MSGLSSLQSPTPDEIASARRILAGRDPALARADALTPPFVWRLRPGGFQALLKLIVEQQISVTAAAAIWGRLEGALGMVSPQAVLAQGEAGLRAHGLSGPKARYALAMAEATASSAMDFTALPGLDDEAAAATLERLKGVGRWTAQTYLMFCEGRPDVFPAGDVALQHALRMAEGGETRPHQDQLEARAEAWRPYRGVAAHLLWAFYGVMKSRAT